VETSSSVMTLSFGCVTLTRITLYVRVDKENSLGSLLNYDRYLYRSDYLYMFTDPTSLNN